MNNRNSLAVIQLKHSYVYFDLHQEMFWLGSLWMFRIGALIAVVSGIVKVIVGCIIFGKEGTQTVCICRLFLNGLLF